MGKQNMKNINVNNNDKNLVFQYFGNNKEIEANNYLQMVNDKEDEGEKMNKILKKIMKKKIILYLLKRIKIILQLII